MRHEDTKRKYQGVSIAAPTPMHDDESVDLPRLRDLIRRYVDAGMTDGNAVCTILGAGGEAMCLDEMERRKVAETAVEVADGKIPIFIGVGHTRTRTAVDLARHADQIGADGLQLELPYYFAATPGDAFAYISEVAKAVECGIALYPTPWTSNFEFDGPFVERVCAALPNVVGLQVVDEERLGVVPRGGEIPRAPVDRVEYAVVLGTQRIPGRGARLRVAGCQRGTAAKRADRGMAADAQL